MSDEHRLVRALLAALLAAYPKDYRDRYGTELLAVSRERAEGRRWPGLVDVADLAGGVVRVRLSRVREAGRHERLREGLAVAGVLAPVLMLGGLAAPLHEVAWFVWNGGLAGLPWREAAGSVPLWAVWAVVAVLALLGRRRAAAGLAWVGVVALVVGTAVGLVPRDAVIGGWLSLGLVAALALGGATRSGAAVVGGWRLAGVAGAVVLVCAARVAGHTFWPAYPLAWLVVGAAVVVACRTTRPALALLAAPALSAAAGFVATELPTGVFTLPWPVVAVVFQGVPLIAAAAVVAVRPGWRGSAAG